MLSCLDLVRDVLDIDWHKIPTAICTCQAFPETKMESISRLSLLRGKWAPWAGIGCFALFWSITGRQLAFKSCLEEDCSGHWPWHRKSAITSWCSFSSRWAVWALCQNTCHYLLLRLYVYSGAGARCAACAGWSWFPFQKPETGIGCEGDSLHYQSMCFNFRRIWLEEIPVFSGNFSLAVAIFFSRLTWLSP